MPFVKLDRVRVRRVTDNSADLDDLKRDLLTSAIHGTTQSPEIAVCKPRRLPTSFVAARLGGADGISTVVCVCVKAHPFPKAMSRGLHLSDLSILVEDSMIKPDAESNRRAVRTLQLIKRCRSALVSGDAWDSATAALLLGRERWEPSADDVRKMTRALPAWAAFGREGGSQSGIVRGRQKKIHHSRIVKTYRKTKHENPELGEIELRRLVSAALQGYRKSDPTWPSLSTVRDAVLFWKRQNREASRPVDSVQRTPFVVHG